MRYTRKAEVSSVRVAVATAAMIVASFGSIHAQVAFGLTVGPSLTNLSGSFIESSQMTAGLYVGGTLEWQVNDRWAVETAVTSLQRGAFSVEGVGVEGTWDVRTSYLDIPVRVRYLIPFADDKWIFGPFIGASFSFNGSCEIREAEFPAFDDACTEETAFGPTSTTDFLYAFGIVVDRVFGTSAVGFDIRYSRGTRDLFIGPAGDGLTSKTNAIDIKLRLVFPHFGDSRW